MRECLLALLIPARETCEHIVGAVEGDSLRGRVANRTTALRCEVPSYRRSEQLKCTNKHHPLLGIALLHQFLATARIGTLHPGEFIRIELARLPHSSPPRKWGLRDSLSPPLPPSCTFGDNGFVYLGRCVCGDSVWVLSAR